MVNIKDLLQMSIKELPNGMRVVNTSPHSLYLKFNNGKKKPKFIQLEPGFPEIVDIFSIETAGETVCKRDDLGVEFIYPSFQVPHKKEVEEALQWAEENDVYFISSIWTALAIPHKRVIVVITNQRKDTRTQFKYGYGNKYTTFYKGGNE